METAIKLIEPLTVNSDGSTVVWPSQEQLADLIQQDLADRADTELWDRVMPDTAGLLDAD
jgi:hypothetical protein